MGRRVSPEEAQPRHQVRDGEVTAGPLDQQVLAGTGGQGLEQGGGVARQVDHHGARDGQVTQGLYVLRREQVHGEQSQGYALPEDARGDGRLRVVLQPDVHRDEPSIPGDPLRHEGEIPDVVGDAEGQASGFVVDDRASVLVPLEGVGPVAHRPRLEVHGVQRV